MQDLKTSFLLEVADSPITTKATVVLGAGSVAGQWTEYMPIFLSVTGSAIAGVAGVFLIIRHWSQHKLNKAQMIKTRLEIDELLLRKAEMANG